MIKKLLAALALAAGSISAQSATLITAPDGLLLGANGVTVDGVLYNVRFVDGTYADVYGTSAPLFQSLESGLAAANAILYEVIQSPGPHNYELQPEWVNGCTAGHDVCHFLTPYFDPVENARWYAIGDNYPTPKSADEVSMLPSVPVFETGDWVWAGWSLASASVPEPGALALAAAALFSAGLARRRGQK